MGCGLPSRCHPDRCRGSRTKGTNIRCIPGNHRDEIRTGGNGWCRRQIRTASSDGDPPSGSRGDDPRTPGSHRGDIGTTGSNRDRPHGDRGGHSSARHRECSTCGQRSAADNAGTAYSSALHAASRALANACSRTNGHATCFSSDGCISGPTI